jgi:hypothetical protein
MIKLAALAAGGWVEQRTAEYRISNRRMPKGGIALLSLFKIDRIHYFDIRNSLFDIRYSLFQSFFFDQRGCFGGQWRR